MYKLERLEDVDDYCVARQRDRYGKFVKQDGIDTFQLIRMVINGEESQETRVFVKLVLSKGLYVAKRIIKDKDKRTISLFDFVGCEINKVKVEEIIYLLKRIEEGFTTFKKEN